MPVNLLESCRLMFVIGAGASVPLGMPTTKSLQGLNLNRIELWHHREPGELRLQEFRRRVG